ncbi:MAG: ATP-binding cassette domain-containing protein [Lachnospiraceae bacterium]|nr:ATP-binding cassette domain-containing protein [Lachnospiraceae bacterium]
MEICLNHISKTLQKNTVIDDVTLQLESGAVYGLCGYNGCGKTMLMRLICGLIAPTSGEILVDGQRLGEKSDFVPNTGMLIETPAFLKEYDGFQNLSMLAALNQKVSGEEIRETLARVGLGGNMKKFRKYSLGMKQRLGIAAAIMEKPQLLLLDEPTNALDSGGVEMMKRIFTEEKERGALVVTACHDAAFLGEVSDVIYHIENGQIIRKEEIRNG